MWSDGPDEDDHPYCVPESIIDQADTFAILTGNLSPYIENEPVPSPLRKSPPVWNTVSQPGSQ